MNWNKEQSLLYYALCKWRTKPNNELENSYTLHRKTSTIALNIMVIHAIALETVGLHYLIHKFSPSISWIALLLNVYTVIFLIAQIQAIRLKPIIINEESVLFQVGLTKSIRVPYSNIRSFKPYDGPEKIPNKEKTHLFEAMVIDFTPEKPQFDLLLQEPIPAVFLYGIKKPIERIVIRVDEPQEFEMKINQHILKYKKSMDS
ncbi:hypothetical protein GCM10008967_13510 [Bacillus carboniphilus]|uniref:DUF304 domain-containing protein n=1 Tax=Bacillus carboniphilus TaxID=86663 RepID=A0ABP3FRX9_9BACI